jgi:hypothetical protein
MYRHISYEDLWDLYQMQNKKLIELKFRLEQKEKPFNPSSLGFSVDYEDSLAYFWTDHKFILEQSKEYLDFWGIWSYNKYKQSEYELLYSGKIPDHDFGVKILDQLKYRL